MALRLKSPEPALPPFSLSPSSPATSTSATDDPASPQTTLLPAEHIHIYGQHPLEQDIGAVACPNCHKPILKSAILEHNVNCKKIREGPVQSDSISNVAPPASSSVPSSSASAPGPEDAKKNGKKRKASEMDGIDASPSAAKKRAKPTPRVTKGRVKGPVDVDRQCGVINDKGLPCSRSLTCKSHAMGAKRAVEGRSKSYDELLLEWNRAHKPNFVEPVKRQTKEEKKIQREKEKAEKAAQKQAEKESALAAAIAAGEKPKKSGGGGGGGGGGSKKKAKVDFMVDAPMEEEVQMDEMEKQLEVDRLVNAVRTLRSSGYGAAPLAAPNDARLYFLKRRELVVSSRELLTQALQGW